MILVTGAAGHLGNVLLKTLCDSPEYSPVNERCTVRAMLLPGEDSSSIRGLPVETVYGDVRKKDDLLSAMEGCDAVFHLAGIIDISRGSTDALFAVNVGGTINVVNACLEKKIGRLVYVSSVHAFPPAPKDEELTEHDGFPFSGLGDPYSVSKSQATAAVLDGVKRGLNAVVVHPSGIIGPNDYRKSALGTALRYALSRKRRHFMFGVTGGYDFVDVRDAAKGIIAAYERGVCGRCYILGGNMISVKEIFAAAQRELGTKPKMVLAPASLAVTLSYPCDFFARLFRKRTVLTPTSVAVLTSNGRISHTLASSELGYAARPAEETLHDTCLWLMEKTAADKSAKKQAVLQRRSMRRRKRAKT